MIFCGSRNLNDFRSQGNVRIRVFLNSQHGTSTFIYFDRRENEMEGGRKLLPSNRLCYTAVEAPLTLRPYREVGSPGLSFI